MFEGNWRQPPPELFYWASGAAEGVAEQQRPLLAQVVERQVELGQEAAVRHQGLRQTGAARGRQLAVEQAAEEEISKGRPLKV